MHDLTRFFCQNPDGSLYGRRDAGNLTACGRFGKHNHIPLLYCRACKYRFSERPAGGRDSLFMATCYRFASNTRLNGVLVAIRKREKPPLVTTSSNAAGPAWAPSDSPPAWLKAEGTQTAVERA
jgi:hypothetical protein